MIEGNLNYKRYLWWSGPSGDTSKQPRFGILLKKKVELLYLDILKRALRKDLSGQELLEIGPGGGAFVEAATKEGIKYFGVENCEVLANSLKEKALNVISEEFCDATFEDKKFDIIYLSHVIEHVDTRFEAVNLISTCYKKLKEGGIIMINAPNVLSHKFDFWLADYTHNFVTTPLRVKTLLIDCGFNCIYEQRTVLLFRNLFILKLIQLLFHITPDFIIELIANRFFAKGKGYFRIFGHENFSIVAKKT
ncbi:MAG: class I SAM-dependent methyltransferase [Candidatus Omnitrophica bacterium]|nr:class I SAM-dependent methyltransferase [Candidatus Omnitrophota bacterium]